MSTDRNTTHTIRYEQPGALAGLPFNKAAQFTLGAAIIFVAFKLYWTGWFSAEIFEFYAVEPEQSDGLGNPIGLLPFLLDVVCLVGIAGFAVLSLIKSSIGPVWAGVQEWVTGARAESAADEAAIVASTTEAEPQPGTASSVAAVATIDPNKLLNTLKNLTKRLSAAELQLSEIQGQLQTLLPEPVPEPTAEELAAEVEKLKSELEAAKTAKPSTRSRSRKS